MSDDSGGFDLTEAITRGAKKAKTYLTPFGTERQQHVCQHCQTACEPTTTYDPRRAAFDGGESPAWRCGDCGREYVREADDSVHGLDQYGRE